MHEPEHLSGRGAARAEDAHGTLTQSHISPSILVNEDKLGNLLPVFSFEGTYAEDNVLPHEKVSTY